MLKFYICIKFLHHLISTEFHSRNRRKLKSAEYVDIDKHMVSIVVDFGSYTNI